jgi:hypothetical protein
MVTDFYQKLFSRPCKIAYLGGSVTVQKNGYRPRLHQLICEATRHDHSAINAGIGGVGSLAHAFLLNDFVLKHHPDFCFVECAIVDSEGMTPIDQIYLSINSICWQLSNHQIPSCFLQLFKTKEIEFYRTILRDHYAPIAKRYQIPSINLQNYCEGSIKQNLYKSNELLYDQIHTTNFGAQVFAQEIFKQWIEKLTASNEGGLVENRASNKGLLIPQIVGANSLALKVDGRYEIKRFKLTIPYLELPINSTWHGLIDFGEVLGILMVADTDSGVIEIKSAHSTHLAQIHDQWCNSARIQAVLLPQAIALNVPFSITLSHQSKTLLGANLHHHPWEHLGSNLKIIGLMINRTAELNTPNYLW